MGVDRILSQISCWARCCPSWTPFIKIGANSRTWAEWRASRCSPIPRLCSHSGDCWRRHCVSAGSPRLRLRTSQIDSGPGRLEQSALQRCSQPILASRRKLFATSDETVIGSGDPSPLDPRQRATWNFPALTHHTGDASTANGETELSEPSALKW